MDAVHDRTPAAARRFRYQRLGRNARLKAQTDHRYRSSRRLRLLLADSPFGRCSACLCRSRIPTACLRALDTRCSARSARAASAVDGTVPETTKSLAYSASCEQQRPRPAPGRNGLRGTWKRINYRHHSDAAHLPKNAPDDAAESAAVLCNHMAVKMAAEKLRRDIMTDSRASTSVRSHVRECISCAVQVCRRR